MFLKSLVMPLFVMTSSIDDQQSERNDLPIIIEKHDVYPKTSATQRLICEDIEWVVRMDSDSRERRVTGYIMVKIGEEGRYVNEAQGAVFEKLEWVNNVKHTCVHYKDADHPVSSLVIDGAFEGSDDYMCTQIFIDREFGIEIRVTPYS